MKNIEKNLDFRCSLPKNMYILRYFGIFGAEWNWLLMRISLQKLCLSLCFFSVHPTDDIWHSKTVIYYSLCENDHRLSDYNGDDSSSPMSDWVVNVNDLWWKNMNMCKYKSSPGYQISVFFVWKSSRMRTENSLFLVNNDKKTPGGRDFF